LSDPLLGRKEGANAQYRIAAALPAAGSLVLCAKIGKEQGLRRVLALDDTPDLPWQTTGNCGAQSYGD